MARLFQQIIVGELEVMMPTEPQEAVSIRDCAR